MRTIIEKANPKEIAKTLNRAAEILKTKGWTPYPNLYTSGGRCALQALAVAVNERRSKGLWFGCREALISYLDLGERGIGAWNDSQSESSIVIDAFQTAARQLQQGA